MESELCLSHVAMRKKKHVLMRNLFLLSTPQLADVEIGIIPTFDSLLIRDFWHFRENSYHWGKKKQKDDPKHKKKLLIVKNSVFSTCEFLSDIVVENLIRLQYKLEGKQQ